MKAHTHLYYYQSKHVCMRVFIFVCFNKISLSNNDIYYDTLSIPLSLTETVLSIICNIESVFYQFLFCELKNMYMIAKIR